MDASSLQEVPLLIIQCTVAGYVIYYLIVISKTRLLFVFL